MSVSLRVCRPLVSPNRQLNLSRLSSQLSSRQTLQPPTRPRSPTTCQTQTLDHIPQPWHEFRESSNFDRWVDLDINQVCLKPPHSPGQTTPPMKSHKLTLLTWNVNAASIRPQARTAALLSYVLTLTPAIDIIFLQEVSRLSLKIIMEDPRIRASWYSSDVDSTHWGRQPFATVTLLSRARFEHDLNRVAGRSCLVLGCAYRIKYGSRYGRDALCADIRVFPPLSSDNGNMADSSCIRLINVHLDSRAVRPSYRPEQVATVATALRDAGSGLVAGDFNLVLPEETTLVTDNGLVDAWNRQTGHASRRLDKIGLLGLDVQAINVLRPGVLDYRDRSRTQAPQSRVPWSDHSALMCTISWPGTGL